MAMLNLFQIKFLDRSPSPTLVCRPILGYRLGEWGEDEQTNKQNARKVNDLNVQDKSQ